MSSVTKEQLLSIMYGVLIKNKGATASQRFTGIPGSTFLAKGADGLVATLAATNVPDVTLTTGTTANLQPGMVIIETGNTAGNFFVTSGVDNVVHSIQSATQFKVGNFAEYAVTGLKATLALNTNVVTLTTGTTDNLRVGMKVTKVTVSGETGAFEDATTYIMAITGRTTFTVGQSLANTNVVTTAANHSAAGAITFYAGGETRNHAATGAITFAVGGIDLTNGQIPGTGDSKRQNISLATSTETIVKDAGGNAVLVCLNGGNIQSADLNSTLSLVEEDYHYTGQILRRKLK